MRARVSQHIPATQASQLSLTKAEHSGDLTCSPGLKIKPRSELREIEEPI